MLQIAYFLAAFSRASRPRVHLGVAELVAGHCIHSIKRTSDCYADEDDHERNRCNVDHAFLPRYVVPLSTQHGEGGENNGHAECVTAAKSAQYEGDHNSEGRRVHEQ